MRVVPRPTSCRNERIVERDCGARCASVPKQTASVVDAELLPLGSPLKEIPSDVFGDLKSRLASRIDIDLGGAGGMLRVDLQKFAAQADTLEAASSGSAERVAADAAGDDAVIAEQARHVREIGGSAAEFFSFGQNIPKEFAEAHDVVRLIRHGASSKMTALVGLCECYGPLLVGDL